MSCDNRCIGDDVFPAPCGTCAGRKPSAAASGYDRKKIVTGMCFTWRHDYGLMEAREKETLYACMDQVFEHDIKPLLDKS